MAAKPASPVQQVPAKHTHYVSLENGTIHPALSYPSGYEDDHPTEWRPASAAEVAKYKKGEESTVTVQPVMLNPADELATPSTITLAEDEPVLPEIVNAAVPAAPAPAPVIPAPAFGGTTKSE